jgi:hypothetical protein
MTTFRRRGLMVGQGPSDTESDAKASGFRAGRQVRAEGDARPPEASDAFPGGRSTFRAKSPPSGEAPLPAPWP